MTLPIYYTLYTASQDWSSRPLTEQESFLSAGEREKLSSLRFPKRRGEWLQGRWAAKHLLRDSRPETHSLSLREIEISYTPLGAPVLQFPGVAPFQGSLSISHSERKAFCALSFHPEYAIGADLEKIEGREPAFVEDYFTAGEKQTLDTLPPAQHDTWITLVWSAKEAMLKSLGQGLRLDTRRVEILTAGGLEAFLPQDNYWQSLHLQSHLAEAWIWAGWWRQQDGCVLTLTVCSHTPIDQNTIHLQEINSPGK